MYCVFDLDGTLVDSLPSITNALNKALTQLGREPVAAQTVKTWIGNA